MGPDDMVGVEESLYLEDAQHLWLFCGEGLGAPLLGAGDPQEACLWGTDPPGWLLNQPQKGPEARIHLLGIDPVAKFYGGHGDSFTNCHKFRYSGTKQPV